MVRFDKKPHALQLNPTPMYLSFPSECGGNVTDKKSGVIQTPNYPSTVSQNTTCVWIITLPTPAKNSGVSILNFFYNLKGYKELAG